MAAGRRTRIFGRDPADNIALDPSQAGLPRREKVKLPPEVAAHARLNAEVLQARPGPALDRAVFTAGVIPSLVGAAADIAAGVNRARQILESGAAQRRLELARSYR